MKAGSPLEIILYLPLSSASVLPSLDLSENVADFAQRLCFILSNSYFQVFLLRYKDGKIKYWFLNSWSCLGV